MEVPLLYRQLQDQLRQWVCPVDQRHLQVFCEILAAILQSGSGALGKWIPYLGHRNCQARAHLERFSYFLHNPQITAERFYEPMLRHVLKAFAGEAVLLTLDTSMLWEQFCLIEVCLVWGGRSFTLAQTVLEHGSATVGFEHYQPVLERAKRVLPKHVQVTLLADRGFEHGNLMQWLTQQQWSWAIRVKSNLQVQLSHGDTQSVEQLIAPEQQVYLFKHVQVLDGITGHLATARVTSSKDPWAVLSNQPPSIQTFALYGKRFGGIEPHFKDYKSAAFNVLQSGLRTPQALTCLVMLLDCAVLIALMLGLLLVQAAERSRLDWHGERGLSFLQLGLRELARLCYQRLPLPKLLALPTYSPPPACASRRKRELLACRIEFSKVVSFS
ncbi:MAG: transposase [Leptolyngbya sp. BL-A-14]